MTGKVTLSGGASATWIFKAATSITPIGGSVVMAGGASACNVYWEIGTAASFNNTAFARNVLAGTAITFTGANSSLVGRALAVTADVTMTGAHIAACTAGTGGGGGGEGNGKDKDKDNEGRGDSDHGDRGAERGKGHHGGGSHDE